MNIASIGYVTCLASLLATACGGSAATVTAPSSSNPFPGVEPITKVFVGSVLDGDDAAPIPGAALGLFPPAATPSMSDDRGHYSLSIAAYNVSLGFFVDVTKT